jgi:membrane protein implicated in regulation of membrane protease activity
MIGSQDRKKSMSYLNTQTLLGTFTFLTLILAVAAIGKLLGLGLSEALYVAALLVIGLVSAAYRFFGKRPGKD